MRLAQVDDDAARAAVVAAFHHLLAERTRPIERVAALRLRRGRPRRKAEPRRDIAQVLQKVAFGKDLVLRPFNQKAERVVAEPEAGARAAFEDRELLCADLPAHERAIAAAGGAHEIGFAARIEFGSQAGAAMVAEPRSIADERQAMRTDRVQVALVKREAGVTIGAAASSSRAPRRTTNSVRRGPRVLRPLDRHNLAAMAAKPAADCALGRVVLALTLRALDEEAHGRAFPEQRSEKRFFHRTRNDRLAQLFHLLAVLPTCSFSFSLRTYTCRRDAERRASSQAGRRPIVEGCPWRPLLKAPTT